MTTWDPDAYLRFADLRERPFDELLARIPTTGATRVVDLGCGPGTATVRLAERWPDATVVGVDASPAMVARAGALGGPRVRFETGDLRTWRPAAPVDVVTANAVLQWVPGHLDLLGDLYAMVAPGGTLAFQVPANFSEPIHTELRRLATSGRWAVPAGLLRDDAVAEPAVYLRALQDLGAGVDVWETTYLQVLHGADAVLEWARGTALRPVTSALPPGEMGAFEADYGAALRAAYPVDGSGRVVLPFRRIFAVARRP